MANTIRDYSATAASNTTVDGADISEGCSPAGINDAIRGVMADLKDVSTGAVSLESPAADSLSLTGALTTTSTIDGRDIAADGTKLDGIEAGATADQTGAEIKAAYEAEADTNAFTDAEKTKLTGVEASADVTDAGNVNPLVDAHLNQSTAASGELLSWNGSDYDWIAAGGGGGGADLYAANESSPAAQPSATGTNAIAIGDSSVSSNTTSISLGKANASGATSFAAQVNNNTTSYGSIAGNSLALGYMTISSGYYTTAMGGFAKASGNYSTAVGYGSQALADYSVALGMCLVYVKGKVGFGAGYYTNFTCSGLYTLNISTTNASQATLTTTNSSASSDNQVIANNNTLVSFHGTINGRQKASEGTACAAWKVEGLLRREASAGTTVLVNSAITVLDNTPNWGMALSADTSNGALKIAVTGASSTNIRWQATIHTSENGYA